MEIRVLNKETGGKEIISTDKFNAKKFSHTSGRDFTNEEIKNFWVKK